MKRSVADSVAKTMFENLHKPEITKFYKQASDEKTVDLSKSQPDQLVDLMLQVSANLEEKGFVVASVLIAKAASCLTHNDVKDCANAEDCVKTDSNDVTMHELLNTPSLSAEHVDLSNKETKSLEEELDELEKDPAYSEITEILNDPELKDLFTQIRNKNVNERRLDSLLDTLPEEEPKNLSEEEQDELLKEIKEANSELDLFLKQAESEENMSEFDQELIDWLKSQGVEVEVHHNKGLDEELDFPGGALGKDLGDDADGLNFDEAFEDEDLSDQEILELLKNDEY